MKIYFNSHASLDKAHLYLKNIGEMKVVQSIIKVSEKVFSSIAAFLGKNSIFKLSAGSVTALGVYKVAGSLPAVATIVSAVAARSAVFFKGTPIKTNPEIGESQVSINNEHKYYEENFTDSESKPAHPSKNESLSSVPSKFAEGGGSPAPAILRLGQSPFMQTNVLKLRHKSQESTAPSLKQDRIKGPKLVMESTDQTLEASESANLLKRIFLGLASGISTVFGLKILLENNSAFNNFPQSSGLQKSSPSVLTMIKAPIDLQNQKSGARSLNSHGAPSFSKSELDLAIEQSPKSQSSQLEKGLEQANPSQARSAKYKMTERKAFQAIRKLLRENPSMSRGSKAKIIKIMAATPDCSLKEKVSKVFASRRSNRQIASAAMRCLTKRN